MNKSWTWEQTSQRSEQFILLKFSSKVLFWNNSPTHFYSHFLSLILSFNTSLLREQIPFLMSIDWRLDVSVHRDRRNCLSTAISMMLDKVYLLFGQCDQMAGYLFNFWSLCTETCYPKHGSILETFLFISCSSFHTTYLVSISTKGINWKKTRMFCFGS